MKQAIKNKEKTARRTPVTRALGISHSAGGASGKLSSAKAHSARQRSENVDSVSDETLVSPRVGVATNPRIQAGNNLPGVEAPRRAPMVTDQVLDKTRSGEEKAQAAQHVNQALVKFRDYQLPVFMDRESGILILHWSRQIGKSYTLASWAVDRLLSQLTKYNSWLITVLSNSRDNGAEFVIKCQEVCNKIGMAMAKPAEMQQIGDAMVYNAQDDSPDLKYENMRMEVRITLTVDGVERIGRIKVLAANPRTARGFSGDLILDEFAFHEDSNAIWEAAEPILSANPEFLCRIASTGNGKHNMFYRMCSGDGPSNGEKFKSASGFFVSRVTRTEAWKMGVKVYDPNTRLPITPEEARKKALDKRAYDQNYECKFNEENMALFTHELISSAEREGVVIDEQSWTASSIARMFRAEGDLFVGNDIGRNRDISVVTVLEKINGKLRVVAMLRMSGMRLPDQQKQIDVVVQLPKFRAFEGDMTGLGLGLVEYLQDAHQGKAIRGVNFSTSEPISDKIRSEGRKGETARVTEIMATEMLGVFEDKGIEIPNDPELRDDLRKPEKITSPGGRVSIAAVRDDAGHADHFWSIALAIRASQNFTTAGRISVPSGRRAQVLESRNQRSVQG